MELARDLTLITHFLGLAMIIGAGVAMAGAADGFRS